MSEFKENTPNCLVVLKALLMRAEADQGFLLFKYNNFIVWAFKGEKILILIEFYNVQSQLG